MQWLVLIIFVALGARLAKASEPLISLEVLGNPVVLLGTVSMFMLQGANIGLSVYLPVYLESQQGLGFFVANKKHQVYSRAERLRRLKQALEAFVHEAVFLDFTADEIRKAVDEKLADLDLQLKPAGERA